MTRAIGESRHVLPSMDAFESSLPAAICARFCDFGSIHVHRGLGLHDARTYRRPRGRDRAFSEPADGLSTYRMLGFRLASFLTRFDDFHELIHCRVAVGRTKSTKLTKSVI